MNLGEYKHWITLFERTYILDDQGGRIETLVPVGQCWAFVQEKEDTVQREGMREEYENKLECLLKTTKRVEPGMVIQFQGRLYEIKSAVRNLATIYDVKIVCREMNQ